MTYNILVVDDSKLIQLFIKESLSSYGLNIDFANNGQDAVDLLKLNQKKYDLILLDWEMPVLTGPEAYAAIRSLNIQFPVIMVTSKNKPEEILSMLDQGASEYVMKPFTKEILIEKIKTVLVDLP